MQSTSSITAFSAPAQSSSASELKDLDAKIENAATAMRKGEAKRTALNKALRKGRKELKALAAAGRPMEEKAQEIRGLLRKRENVLERISHCTADVRELRQRRRCVPEVCLQHTECFVRRCMPKESKDVQAACVDLLVRKWASHHYKPAGGGVRLCWEWKDAWKNVNCEADRCWIGRWQLISWPGYFGPRAFFAEEEKLWAQATSDKEKIAILQQVSSGQYALYTPLFVARDLTLDKIRDLVANEGETDEPEN